MQYFFLESISKQPQRSKMLAAIGILSLLAACSVGPAVTVTKNATQPSVTASAEAEARRLGDAILTAKSDQEVLSVVSDIIADHSRQVDWSMFWGILIEGHFDKLDFSPRTKNRVLSLICKSSDERTYTKAADLVLLMGTEFYSTILSSFASPKLRTDQAITILRSTTRLDGVLAANVFVRTSSIQFRDLFESFETSAWVDALRSLLQMDHRREYQIIADAHRILGESSDDLRLVLVEEIFSGVVKLEDAWNLADSVEARRELFSGLIDLSIKRPSKVTHELLIRLSDYISTARDYKDYRKAVREVDEEGIVQTSALLETWELGLRSFENAIQTNPALLLESTKYQSDQEFSEDLILINIRRGNIGLARQWFQSLKKPVGKISQISRARLGVYLATDAQAKKDAIEIFCDSLDKYAQLPRTLHADNSLALDQVLKNRVGPGCHQFNRLKEGLLIVGATPWIQRLDGALIVESGQLQIEVPAIDLGIMDLSASASHSESATSEVPQKGKDAVAFPLLLGLKSKIRMGVYPEGTLHVFVFHFVQPAEPGAPRMGKGADGEAGGDLTLKSDTVIRGTREGFVSLGTAPAPVQKGGVGGASDLSPVSGADLHEWIRLRYPEAAFHYRANLRLVQKLWGSCEVDARSGVRTIQVFDPSYIESLVSTERQQIKKYVGALNEGDFQEKFKSFVGTEVRKQLAQLIDSQDIFDEWQGEIARRFCAEDLTTEVAADGPCNVLGSIGKSGGIILQ